MSDLDKIKELLDIAGHHASQLTATIAKIRYLISEIDADAADNSSDE